VLAAGLAAWAALPGGDARIDVGVVALIVLPAGRVMATLVLCVMVMATGFLSCCREGRIVEQRQPAGDWQSAERPEKVAPGVGAGQGTRQSIEGRSIQDARLLLETTKRRWMIYRGSYPIVTLLGIVTER
jgi:hypothetical protein